MTWVASQKPTLLSVVLSALLRMSTLLLPDQPLRTCTEPSVQSSHCESDGCSHHREDAFKTGLRKVGRNWPLGQSAVATGSEGA